MIKNYTYRAIPVPPLWAVRPVQGLSACTGVHFTLYIQMSVKLLSNLCGGVEVKKNKFHVVYKTVCNSEAAVFVHYPNTDASLTLWRLSDRET